MGFEGKVAVVTGGSQGIGASITAKLAGKGVKVVSLSRGNQPEDTEMIKYLDLDVTDRKACKEVFDTIVADYGKIDYLVNNAGITQDAMTRKMTDEQWDKVIDVNLNGLFNLTRYVGPHMEANEFGSIVNIASVVGVFGNIGQANYSATKGAVISLTKTWAKEFARKGANVRVNAVAPGYTMTDMMKTVPEDLLEKFAQMTMLKRLAQPEEIANAVVFLLGEESSYITGQTIQVDGGMRL